jgi:ABC-2 type transport system ATP-binding protein
MLKIEDIHVAYGQHQVLQGASLAIDAGTVQGILGMNGAGKTTFFESIYGRLQLQKGHCLYKGQPPGVEDIAFLEAESFFYPYTTGMEHLRLCAFNNPSFKIEIWNDLFQVPLDHNIDTYSTGMKQKLALMGTLATGRPILILDEPFNGIDLESSEILYQVILKLKEQGKYILISSHIMETLLHVCDRISHLEEGRFSHTFEREEFHQMQTQLRAELKSKIQKTLDRLEE